MKTIVLLLFPTALTFIGCQDTMNSEKDKTQISSSEKCETNQPERVEFHAPDSVTIVANVYEIDKTSPVIVLCHQARFNKFEYEGIAQKLNERGFNCIAIDQRSGGPIANHVNQTTLSAEAKNKPTDYLDAEQDIISAVGYAAKRFNRPVILWGSSYSSTLVLYVALENKDVSAVISFSPGNYFSNEKGSLIEKLIGFNKPLFVTSSKEEAASVEDLISKMTLKKNQVHFKPKGEGHHGSRALWEKQSGGEEYWKAIDQFLTENF